MTDATRVAGVTARILELPYRTPMVTATNRFAVATGVLVSVDTDDGTTGYGYADVFPRVGETGRTATHVIETVLAPLVVGRSLVDLGAIQRDLDHALAGNPRARAALDGALQDALARAIDVPLTVLLGGRIRTAVTVIRMVGLGEPDAMAAWATATLDGAQDGGLKLKLGGEIEADIRRVAAVRRAIGDHVYLKVDANESYDAKTAIRLASRLADLGVEVLEQPVPRAQLAALREVTAKSPIAIEADQAVRSVADAAALIRDRAVDAINTGVARVGGFGPARRIAELCEAAGIACTLSNTAGSVVGDAAALQLALSTPGISARCELGEYEAITEDPFTGLVIENGVLQAPAGPGLGIRLRSIDPDAAATAPGNGHDHDHDHEGTHA